MTVQTSANIVTQNAGFSPENVQLPTVQNRAPTTFDVNYPIGKRWVDEVGGSEYSLVQISSLGGTLSANWVLLSPASSSLNSLQGDIGGPVLPTSGLINIVGSNGLIVSGNAGTSTLTIEPTESGFPISPFVVGPSGQAGYQTIASAISAASTAGGGTVYIQPGTYTENLTLVSNVNLVGASSSPTESVEIIGTHTPPTSGSIGFTDIFFSSSGSVLSSAAAGTANIFFDSCLFDINGYIYNLPNWGSGALIINNCNENGSADNGIFNNTGGGVAFSAIIKNSSIGGASSTIVIGGLGTLTVMSSLLNCDIVLSSSVGLLFDYSDIRGTITATGSSSGTITNSYFFSAGTPCFTQNSTGTWTISGNVMFSNAASVIAGTGSGVIQLGFNNFTGTTSTISSSLSTGQTVTLVNSLKYLPVASTTSGGISALGFVTLVGGTATVTSSIVQSNSLIRLTRYAVGSTGANALGNLAIGSISAGVSFVINSVQTANATALQTTDVSLVIWEILR